MSSPLRLAVFDCDGTLVDSQRSIILSMRDSFRRHGLAEPDDNAVKRIVGLPLLDAIARLAPHVGDDDHIRLKEGYSEAFFALRRAKTVHEPLYPGVAAGIDAIAADGWLLGVATGKSLRGLENTLSGHGLLDRFQTLQTSDKAAGKPNPDMLLQAMAETGVDAASTVMIGDTTYDMEMARNAGAVAIGVDWGYHETDELYSAGAEVVVSAFDDLPQAVNRVLENV